MDARVQVLQPEPVDYSGILWAGVPSICAVILSVEIQSGIAAASCTCHSHDEPREEEQERKKKLICIYYN